jgi:choline dehydrogenase
MVWVRGDPADFDLFEHKYGCAGWGWQGVLPYFKKIENFHDKKDPVRGSSGPVEVHYMSSLVPLNPLSQMFLKACVQSGYPANDDYNGASMEGAVHTQVNIRGDKGTRCGAGQAYLRPARTRPNLTVLTGAAVSRIRIEKGEATGVFYRFVGDTTDSVVAARKEVIVSAGALGTPKILQLSGIGPKEYLQPLSIPIVSELPVGKNLQDHIVAPIFFKEKTQNAITLKNLEAIWPLVKYLLTGKGRGAWMAIEVMAFIRTKYAQKAPDLQLHTLPLQPELHPDEWHFKQHFDFKSASHGFYVLPTVLHPRSRSVARLRSTDPTDPPLFENHYLEYEEDLEVLVEGINITRQIMSAPAVAGTLTEITSKAIPHDPKSEEYTTAYARKFTRTLYHHVGSCRMGPAHKDDTVVTPDLRVKGIKNLRVVDLSILPELTSGNTNAVAIMVGEKAYDIITKGSPAVML